MNGIKRLAMAGVAAAGLVVFAPAPGAAQAASDTASYVMTKCAPYPWPWTRFTACVTVDSAGDDVTSAYGRYRVNDEDGFSGFATVTVGSDGLRTVGFKVKPSEPAIATPLWKQSTTLYVDKNESPGTSVCSTLYQGRPGASKVVARWCGPVSDFGAPMDRR